MGDIDWNSDPELKKLRDEFLDSLPERADKIKNITSEFDLKNEVHRLAGAAGSYDCRELFLIAAGLDETLGNHRHSFDELQPYIALLLRGLTLQFKRQSLEQLFSSPDAESIQKKFGKFRML